MADRPLEDLDAAATAYASAAELATPAARTALRERFTHLCLPFAGRLAGRYRGRGEPMDDLEQVARLGLIKSIDRYDPARGSFTAYAVTTITGEIKRHFRDRTWGVHVPRRLQDLSLEVGHTTAVLTHTLSRPPSVTEVAERLGIGAEAVTEAIGSAAGYHPTSLNTPLGMPGDGAELGDLLGGADHDLELVDDKVTMAELLQRLPARERRLLTLRFHGNRTQAEIAAELGVSQMHVSRLLSRVLCWLREAMLSDVPPRWEGQDTLEHRGAEIYQVARDGDVLTVRIRGEADRDCAERLRLGLRHAVAEARPGRLVIDLRRVPLVDAGGVAVLLDAANAAAAANVRLQLAGVQPFVRSLLKVSGLAGLLAPPAPRR